MKKVTHFIQSYFAAPVKGSIFKKNSYGLRKFFKSGPYDKGQEDKIHPFHRTASRKQELDL